MDTFEQKDSEMKNQKKSKQPHLKLWIFGMLIITIIFSSSFGALFGFLAAGSTKLVSDGILQKIHLYLPKLKLKSLETKVSKQQIVIEDSAVIDVVEKSSPAVVSIVISKQVAIRQIPFNSPGGFFEQFFGPSPDTNNPNGSQVDGNGSQKETVGAGSGFFVTSDGLILTNKHVVSDKQAEYKVVTNDGKEHVASVLALDPIRDLAIIKIEGSNFPVLSLGNSDSLKIGQTAIAIGNSLGEFSNSVSRGIVSGLKRNLNASGGGSSERLSDIIQTDAAINLGNSGGPLLDIEGNVIGINVATAQGAQNIGFALPINQAKRLIEQVKTGNKISAPFLGVRYITIDSQVQKDAQLPFDYGVLVLRGEKMTDLAVIPGSPADIAGIMENDIILEVNGEKINQNNQLGDIVAKFNVGDEINLKVWHKGQIKEVKVKLQEFKN